MDHLKRRRREIPASSRLVKVKDKDNNTVLNKPHGVIKTIDESTFRSTYIKYLYRVTPSGSWGSNPPVN